ncbi:MAG: 6-phosphofructokinase [Candidatus Margulisiibacteriota bacterium]
MGVIYSLKPFLTSLDALSVSAGGIKARLREIPALRLRPGQEPRLMGLLFAGGPANVEGGVVEPIVKIAAENGVAVFGFEDGFKGLLDGGKGVLLNPYAVHNFSRQGGGILGTDRLNPDGQKREWIADKFRQWNIEILHGGGGDDTQSSLKRMANLGLKMIGVAKTVDWDLPLTETYGFITAWATIGRILDSYSNETVLTNTNALAQIMGRRSGALTLASSQMSGATRSYIGEEFTQKGLFELVGAVELGDLFAYNVLCDLAAINLIDGQTRTPEWIKTNIASVDAAAVHVNLVALLNQMIGIMSSRKGRGLHDNLFAVAEGIAERLPTVVTEKQPGTDLPIEAVVEIFGKRIPVEYDEHHNPRLGPIKIGDGLKEQLVAKFTTNPKKPAKWIFNQNLTYEGRCVTTPEQADVRIGQTMAIRAITEAIHGRHGFLSGYRACESVMIPFDDLPTDPVTGKIIPRVVDLGSSFYLGAKQLEWLLANQGRD